MMDKKYNLILLIFLILIFMIIQPIINKHNKRIVEELNTNNEYYGIVIDKVEGNRNTKLLLSDSTILSVSGYVDIMKKDSIHRPFKKDYIDVYRIFNDKYIYIGKEYSNIIYEYNKGKW